MRVSVRGDLLREEKRCRWLWLLGGCAGGVSAACLPAWASSEQIPVARSLRLQPRAPRAAHGRGEPPLSPGACG